MEFVYYLVYDWSFLLIVLGGFLEKYRCYFNIVELKMVSVGVVIYVILYLFWFVSLVCNWVRIEYGDGL